MLSMIIGSPDGDEVGLSRRISVDGLGCSVGIVGIRGRMESTTTTSGIVPPFEHRHEMPIAFFISEDYLRALVCVVDKQRLHPHRSAESFLDCDAEFRHNQGEILATVLRQTDREGCRYLPVF